MKFKDGEIIKRESREKQKSHEPRLNCIFYFFLSREDGVKNRKALAKLSNRNARKCSILRYQQYFKYISNIVSIQRVVFHRSHFMPISSHVLTCLGPPVKYDYSIRVYMRKLMEMGNYELTKFL